MPNGISYDYILGYIMGLLCFLVVMGIYIYRYMTKGIYIFEPLTIITFLYAMMFGLEPMINIIINNTTIDGFESISGSIKASAIFICSYIFLIFGYYIENNIELDTQPIIKKIDCAYNSQKIIFFSIIIWLCGLVFCLINLMADGANLQYIFSLGLMGEKNTDLSFENSLAVLGNLKMCMVAPLLYIGIFSNKKLIKVLLYIITCLLVLNDGYRYVLIILIAAPYVLHYINMNREPKTQHIFMMIGVLSLMIGTVQFTRTSIRSGGGANFKGFDYIYIWKSMAGNFDLYKAFYGMVEAIPNVVNYQFGEQMIWATIYTIIPRVIWQGKPKTPIILYLKYFVGHLGADSGWAFPNIAEYYFDFGIMGCLLCMFLFGYFTGKCKRLYSSNNRTWHSLITYSIIFPELMQLIIRGYTPTNFYSIFFLLLPIWIIKKIT
jgi:oligosaccharide repeat unit polymerase